jgi:pimeloyl-ACP methyl ester carboxylesterase
MTSPPTELRVEANGLTHRVLAWTPRERSAARTVVLVHGFMDAAGTWDRVAPALALEGYRVLAPDMRGFGATERAPRGSYYHFADYVADLSGIVDALAPGAPIALVGHSMGGTITTLFSGAFPERVVRLASLEGVGPPDNSWEIAPDRMRRWIEQVGAARERSSKAPLRREDAFERLVASHPGVPREVLETRFVHLVDEVASEDGAARVTWRFDPLHRTTSPTPFFAKSFVEFAKRVSCPVLYVSGGPTGFHVEGEDARVSAFRDVRRAVIDGAGHMMHWTKPADLAELLLGFFAA